MQGEMKAIGSTLAALGDDPYLAPYLPRIGERAEHARRVEAELTGGRLALADAARLHEDLGLHRDDGGWVLREWAPNAAAVWLIGPFSGWRESDAFALRPAAGGRWERRLPADALRHGDLYRLKICWDGGEGERIPSCARRVVQDAGTDTFSAQVWAPDRPYAWRHAQPAQPADALFIYEAHVGMAQERQGVGTFIEFRESVLPKILAAGYSAIQLMAVLEHPYYGSFGYHVSSYFAVSSRFGTPEEFKALVDAAHGLGLRVVIDLVHSHATENEAEGLSRFDGTRSQFFHDGPAGTHPLWGSRCFDYGKPEVLRFLLSNCRFWLEEYRVDGFRFDGITSMIYRHHGLGVAFNGYDQYFDGSVDADALAYLTLANQVVHDVNPAAVTIAEDVSGLPGLAAPRGQGGCGFDYRLAMGVPDCWFRLVREVRDEDWNLGYLWHELTNRRPDERAVSYVECHDQAIVGDKTLIFHLLDRLMYTRMRREDSDPVLDRGIALHKMIRLATVATAGHGYLTFMGNEFGHPEWIDFPREGNGWSYWYARRQWRLRDDPGLKYGQLAEFDRAMINLFRRRARLAATSPLLARVHEEDKVLAFTRGPLLMLLNFHPCRSLADYVVPAPRGSYVLDLDTDAAQFGGQGRVAAGQRYVTGSGAAGKDGLSVYLPCRTALVLRRVRAAARQRT